MLFLDQNKSYFAFVAPTFRHPSRHPLPLNVFPVDEVPAAAAAAPGGLKSCQNGTIVELCPYWRDQGVSFCFGLVSYVQLKFSSCGGRVEESY